MNVINILNSNKCNINNNSFSINDTSETVTDLTVIQLDSSAMCNGIRIKENLCYNFSDTQQFYGVTLDGEYETIDIEKNVFILRADNTVGVLSSLSGTNKVKIKNNLFVVDNLAGATGISCVWVDAEDIETDFEIHNNIFYGRSEITSNFALNITNYDKCVIDNNCFYNFGDYVYQSEIVGADEHSIFDNDPLILKYLDGTNYDTSAYDSFFLSANSPCLGLGINYENIGLGTNNEEMFTSFVDTVTHNLGYVNISSPDVELTFLNTVFTESIDLINEYYNKGYTFGSTDVFNNQYSWDFVDYDIFPFLSGSDLYNKSLSYVILNKDKIEPFEGISCPANPGYGFSAYSEYETGLFGYNRSEYINTCIEEECIIQDSYTETYIIQDSIDGEIILQDAINPPCI
jgi:hypothetical protein